MIYRVAICDDSEVDTGYVSDLLQKWAGKRNVKVTTEKFPSAEAFLFRYAEEKSFDILLLDIEMEGMDGVSLAEKIRSTDPEVPIVFITGYPDYIAMGYDVAALHYLVKPITEEKFFEVLDRAVSLTGRKKKPLLFPAGKEEVLVDPETIVYAESQGHYMLLHTECEEYRLRMTMQEMADLLGEDFFQCGRSFIVGLKWIGRISKKTIVLADRTELPLGKGLHDQINLALIRYLRK